MIDEEKSAVGSAQPPHASDVLFGTSTEDWHLNACIEHSFDVDYPYKAGFRKAAFQLAEQMCREPVDQDSIVYPIVYLYRHHTELMLKDILRLASDLLDHKTHIGGHDLAKLWSLIRPLLNRVCKMPGEAPLSKDDLDGIDAYMSQLNAHDPNGESFRYARSRDAKRTLGTDLVRINIRSFTIHMEKLADYLGMLENWLAMLVDGRNEARRG